jgi:phosphatidylserine/phosphatidylglycerophosphate/cardiolipin synthase-like enzyme
MIDDLHQIPTLDLRAIADALRSGRLAPPFTVTGLQRYCTADLAPGLARAFDNLNTDGMNPTHMALLLDCAVEARKGCSKSGDIDLVWSGPEVPGTTCRDTGVVVRELFANACSSVLVVGFAVKQGKDVFRALAQRMDQIPNMTVRFFLNIARQFGHDLPSAEIIREFLDDFKTNEWPGSRLPEVYYDPRSLETNGPKRSSLHAKCIVIDRRIAFISSANFTEAAQLRNIEVGAVIHNEQFAVRLGDQFGHLVDAGVLIRC